VSIAALQDKDDPRARGKEQGCSPRLTQNKRGICLALVGALELLPADAWNGLIFLPKYIIKNSRIDTARVASQAKSTLLAEGITLALE
jgi:hypothetical protein